MRDKDAIAAIKKGVCHIEDLNNLLGILHRAAAETDLERESICLGIDTITYAVAEGIEKLQNEMRQIEAEPPSA